MHSKTIIRLEKHVLDDFGHILVSGGSYTPLLRRRRGEKFFAIFRDFLGRFLESADRDPMRFLVKKKN